MIGLTNAINDIKKNQLVNYTMLYDYGDECEEITGGWTGVVKYVSSSATGLFEKNTNYMKMRSLRATAYTREKVDLNGYIRMASFKAYVKGRTDVTTDSACQAFQVTQTLKIGEGLINSDWAFTWRETHNKHRTGSSGYTNFINDMTIFKTSSDNTPVELSGSYYIGVMCDGTPSNSEFIDLYNLAIFKKDNWEELCTVAGLNSSDYADEPTLCANSIAISTILSNEEAVKYMIYNCTGTFMMEFINSNIALTELNNSSFKTIIQANEHWNKFLNMVA